MQWLIHITLRRYFPKNSPFFTPWLVHLYVNKGLWQWLTGKKHCQIKLQLLQKVRMWVFGSLVHQINYLQKVLKPKQNFQKNKIVTGKTLFFVIGPFCTHTILFVLTLASDLTILYGNYVLSILVLSTKKRYSSFMKRFLFSRNSFSKLKYWICSKFPLIVT